MQNTIFILPSGCHTTNGTVSREIRLMKKLSQGDQLFFHFSNNDVSNLKKLLIENDHDVIVAGFFALDTECPDLRMIKSLSPDSRLVLYCPDMKLVKGMTPLFSSNAELNKWYETGKSIALGMFRYADLIVVASEEDKMFLQKSIPATPLMTIDEIEGSDSVTVEGRKDKKVSIIMLTFNQFSLTRQCVESLFKHTPLEYELIIVDNGSADGTKEYLRQLAAEHENVKLIFNEINVGFSKANNQGMRIAEGEYILLLNNDVILTEGWLKRMLLCAESNPEIGVVGPCTNNAVAQQIIGVQIDCNEADIQRFAHMQLLSNAGNWFVTHRIIGFCMLIKREVIERVGMLDERFGPGGFEDYDYCLRVNQAKYTIMIAGDVFIYHIGGQGYRANNLDYAKLREQNVQIFIEKWCRKALEVIEVMPNGM